MRLSFYLSNHPEKLGAEAWLRAKGKPITPQNLKIVNDAIMEAVERAIVHDARGLAPPILPPQSVKLAGKAYPFIRRQIRTAPLWSIHPLE